ncbi:hypothetical protein GGR57DRAFT_51147 [Xylariaceae sp. FL1272]|nr:hypothetical protein GGR57DRAFT_51147 [Xylariaceae sp. FL1272]
MAATLTRPVRSLKGRVAIVTGAGALPGGIGNGRAAAVMLAEDGCSVVCVDLKQHLAQETVAMIEQEGLGAGLAIAADVTNADDCQNVVDVAIAHFGRLDILVNSVGIVGAKGNAVEVDMADFFKDFEINVGSMVQMAKACIPKMKVNKGQWAGSIVNMGSVAGLRGGGPNLLYPTSKGAIVNMTRAMATHHAPDRIRVNCVCPGMVYTPMMYGADGVGMTEAERQARRERSLLKTEGNGWDVGAAIRFLAGDEARWLTGVVLPVDAGATCATGIGMEGLNTSTTLRGNTQ